MRLLIHNKIHIKFLDPPKSIRDYLTDQFWCFVSDGGGNVDVEVQFVDRIRSKGLTYISSLACYDEKRFFLIDKYGNKSSLPFDALTEDRCKVVAEKDIDPGFFFRSILQSIIRYRLIRHDIAYVHSSAVEYKGQGILFPAWGGIGKTSLLLRFMEDGARYMADDRVLVSSEGKMLIHNTALNLLHYNYKEFPRLRERLDMTKKVFFFANRFIERVSEAWLKWNSKRSFFNKVIVAVRDLSNKTLWTEVDVRKVFPESGISIQTSLDKIFFMSRVAEEDFRVRPFSAEELARRMAACLRGDLNKMERAYQMFLFAFPYKDNPLVQNAPEEELKIMEKAFSGKDIWSILIPKEADSKEVFELVKSLL